MFLNSSSFTFGTVSVTKYIDGQCFTIGVYLSILIFVLMLLQVMQVLFLQVLVCVSIPLFTIFDLHEILCISEFRSSLSLSSTFN